MNAHPEPLKAEDTSDAVPLEELMNTRIARFATRNYDWGALKFQADVDPRYRRAQIRYVGTGGTGVKTDGNTVPAEHFTFSNMLLPAGCHAPLHVHTDVEEVFFILRGKVRLFFEYEGQKWDTVLGERDLISIPPHIWRGLINEGDEDAIMCVMLGTNKPVLPHYPADHPLSKVKRA